MKKDGDGMEVSRRERERPRARTHTRPPLSFSSPSAPPRTHVRHAVPAGLAPPGDGVVHDVVRDQEEGLQPFNAPAERVGRKLGVRRQPRRAAGGLGVGGQGVGNGHAPVELAAGDVEVEHLRGERKRKGRVQAVRAGGGESVRTRGRASFCFAPSFSRPAYLLDVRLGKGGLVAQQLVGHQLVAQLLVDGEEGLREEEGGGGEGEF